MRCKIIYALKKKKKFGIFVEFKNFSQQIIYFVLSKISNSNDLNCGNDFRANKPFIK